MGGFPLKVTAGSLASAVSAFKINIYNSVHPLWAQQSIQVSNRLAPPKRYGLLTLLKNEKSLGSSQRNWETFFDWMVCNCFTSDFKLRHQD